MTAEQVRKRDAVYDEAHRLGIPVFSKEQEYDRTAEMVRDILNKNKDGNGAAFALWLLADSGYTAKETAEVAKRLYRPKK